MRNRLYSSGQFKSDSNFSTRNRIDSPMCSRAWQDLELQARRRYTVSSAVFLLFFEFVSPRPCRSPKLMSNFVQNNRVKALFSKTRVKALVQKKNKKSIDLSFQVCFVNGAVYPVIGRGGRQVRPRLIFKVNCKRVNMFKRLLLEIKCFFNSKIKGRAVKIQPYSSVNLDSELGHGHISLYNQSTKLSRLLFMNKKSTQDTFNFILLILFLSICLYLGSSK